MAPNEEWFVLFEKANTEAGLARFGEVRSRVKDVGSKEMN